MIQKTKSPQEMPGKISYMKPKARVWPPACPVAYALQGLLAGHRGLRGHTLDMEGAAV